MSANNKQVDTGVARAARLFASGDLRRAEQAANAARAAAPAQANQILAGIALKRGDLETGFGYAAAAVDAAPSSAKLLLNLATIEFALGRRADALATFEKAALSNPRDFEAQLGHGKMLAEMGRLEEALAQLKRAHQIVPHPRAKGPIADALFKLERYEEAEEWALGAVAVGLDTAELNCLIGKIHFARRQSKKAIEAFNTALAKDPEYTDALMGLSCAQARLNDLVAARDATRRYLELRPVVRIGAKEPKAHVAAVHPLVSGYFNDPRYGKSVPQIGNLPGMLDCPRLQLLHYHAPLFKLPQGFGDGPRADVVYSNLINAELLVQGENAERARATLAHFGAPVVNPVDAALATTRWGNAARFAKSEWFRYPRAILVHRQGRSAADVAHEIQQKVSFPAILRLPFTQLGISAVFARNAAEAKAQISRFKDDIICAIEFVDTSDDKGVFSRYRLFRVGEKTISEGVHASKGWNVHASGRKEFNWQASGRKELERQFLADPSETLGFDVDVVFAEIWDKTELDIFGMDFSIDRSGHPVIFEVNANMGGFRADWVADWDYLLPAKRRFMDVVEEYLISRAAG